MNKVLALALVLAFGNLGVAQEIVPPSVGQGLEDGSLLERLRSGGLVIVFRHGKTGENPDVPNAVSQGGTYDSAKERQAAYFDCARQRNLSDEGREELRAVAAAISRIGLVVDEVLSSPMCRTRETAWLLFGQVTPNDALIGPVENSGTDSLAGAIPADGGNRVLVTHGGVVTNIVWRSEIPTVAGLTPEGYGFVLEPHGNDEYHLLARLGPDDWLRLANLAQH